MPTASPGIFSAIMIGFGRADGDGQHAGDGLVDLQVVPGALRHEKTTNIAEDVIYIVRGEDVRERGDKERRKGLRAAAPTTGPASTA